jgi:predicted ATPase/DNA-binding CsgD family transcriptional regulator
MQETLVLVTQFVTAYAGFQSEAPQPDCESGPENTYAANRLDCRLNGLPLQLSSFVGREPETVEVRRLLDTTRLLTLTGVGGVGKTRLALHVVAQLAATSQDAVCLVELASLAEPALVPNAVASALGIPEQPGRPQLETLAEYLQAQPLLLLLDNCEHWIGACAELTETLLRTCPHLQVLATSREALNIPGEVAWLVPSMTMPAQEALRDVGPATPLPPDKLTAYDAPRLFLERATDALPGFRLSDTNAPAVTEICRQLDGIPLALELAAARVNVLAVEQIAERLDDRFRLLTTGRRTAVSRHHTLRSLVDWSHALLAEREQALFRRLSVFAGGWTLAAAEAVGSGDGVEPSDVLDLLSGLTENSLVLAEPQDDGMRYRMLETLRQYGAERLRESGEADPVRSRHLAWFLHLTERTGATRNAPGNRAFHALLDVELDNLRTALEWSRVDAASIETGLTLAGLLANFWWHRDHAVEGRRWLQTLLIRVSGLAVGPKLPSTAGMRAHALHATGYLAAQQGDLAAARSSLEAAISTWRCLGDRRSLAFSLHVLGRVAYGEDSQTEAKALLEEGLDLSRELGLARPMAQILLTLGRVARAEGNHAQAAVLFEEGLVLARKQGDAMSMSLSLRWLAGLALDRRDLSVARASLCESLELDRNAGEGVSVFRALDLFADLAVAESQPVRALRLAAATETWRRKSGVTHTPLERAQSEATPKRARRLLGRAAAAAAWAEGETMTLAEAVAYALEPDQPASRQRDDPAPAAGLLTPREREVAVLVAQGLSNRQIAAALLVAEGTAGIHVDHILTKLGFHSRAQVAAWAVTHGLVPSA